MNTTGICIVNYMECEELIKALSESSGIYFKLIQDSNIDQFDDLESSGYNVYVFSGKCLGEERIDKLIDAFESTEWVFPELATMTINDDDDVFLGVVRGNGIK